jgi:hypothetical protein
LSDLGVGVRASEAWPQVRVRCSVQKREVCVLSEWLCCGIRSVTHLGFGVWMVPVHGEVFVKGMRGWGYSERSGCLGRRVRV